MTKVKDPSHQFAFDFGTFVGGIIEKAASYVQYVFDFDFSTEVDVGQVWARKDVEMVADNGLLDPEWDKVIIEDFGTDHKGQKELLMKSMRGVPKLISPDLFAKSYYKVA